MYEKRSMRFLVVLVVIMVHMSVTKEGEGSRIEGLLSKLGTKEG